MFKQEVPATAGMLSVRLNEVLISGSGCYSRNCWLRFGGVAGVHHIEASPIEHIAKISKVQEREFPPRRSITDSSPSTNK